MASRVTRAETSTPADRRKDGSAHHPLRRIDCPNGQHGRSLLPAGAASAARGSVRPYVVGDRFGPDAGPRPSLRAQGDSMPTYQSPGVYVEEVAAGARPLEGAGTAIAAFVGLAEEGPFNAPTLVSNWTQFTSTFGGFVAGSYLAQSVYGYFMNGGGNCYVVRIGQNGANSGPAPRSARAKELAASPDRADRPAEGRGPRPDGRPGRRQRRGHRPGRRQPERGHVQTADQGPRRDGRGVRPRQLRPRQAERRHHGQRGLQDRPAGGHR